GQKMSSMVRLAKRPFTLKRIATRCRRYPMKRVFPRLVAVALAMCLLARGAYAQKILSPNPQLAPTVEDPQVTIAPIPGVCPAAVITQPGNYVLAGDVGPCAPGTDGIDIEASNVKLHLNGHTIAGTACGGVFFVNGGIVIGLP